jgi:ParB family transcriptional regulator, chromosome partitioning protein
MTVKRGSLGRNLSMLLGQSGPTEQRQLKPSAEIGQLAIDCLQPGAYQPRGEMEEEPLQDLAQSIKKQGVLQPILVRQLPEGQYEIIAGERRWRASKLAGLTEVPVLLKQVDDETAMAMALVENLQREDLNAMDQARAMHRLTTEFSLTHQQVAELLSKSRAAVSNFLRLLTLTPTVKKMLEHNLLEMGHARALLVLEETQQIQAAELIIAKNLSVRETEQLVARIKASKSTVKASMTPIKAHQEILHSLAHQLRTKVTIKEKASGKGALIIHYDGALGLEQLLRQLMG